MNTRKICFSLALIVAQAGQSFAQGPADALRYSQLQFGGPARTQGIAGANVALGGDFGNLTSNPAGLGLYRKSEVTFSPGIGLGTGRGRLVGSNNMALSEDKNSFHIANLGGVFTNRLADNDDHSDWRGGSFAIGFSRLADFNEAFRYQGTVADNQSLFQRLREPGGNAFITTNAQGQRFYSGDYQNAVQGKKGIFDQNSTPKAYFNLDGLAYANQLTNDSTKFIRNSAGQVVDSVSKIYTRARRGPILQNEQVVSSGSVSQLDFGYGGSYKDRIFVGGAIGIVSSNYRTVHEFSEVEADGAQGATTAFNSLQVRDEVKTSGSGFNARLGVIYRANDVLRLGASVQTPTFMRLTDNFTTSLTTDITGRGTVTNSTGANEYTYTITTPFRANGGLALTLSKYGFVTADAEYVGYGQARIDNDPNSDSRAKTDFSTQNAAIRTQYGNALNLRFGAEGRFGVFRIRAGYAHYADPNRDNTNLDRSQRFYTAGLGLRQKSFFLDVAEVYTAYNQSYSPYSLVSKAEPLVSIANARYTTTVTAGFIF